MKKFSVAMTTAMAVVSASLAFAAPVQLSNAQLDNVSAGQGVFDFVFGDGFTAQGEPVVTSIDTTAADNGAIAGDDNTVVPINVSDNALAITDVDEGGALATDSALAVGAEDNDGSALAQGTGNLALEDTDDNAFATGDGSVALANTDDNALASNGIALVDTNDNTFALGAGSVALTDNDDSIIAAGTGNVAQEIDFDDNEIEEGGMGQIAYEANATNSFNRQDIEIDVEVDIEDSFNVTTNTLDISGQAGITAIVNANTLGDQAIGVNLNLANANSTVPTAQTGTTIEPVSSIDGNALVLTVLDQTVVNNSVFFFGLTAVDGISEL